MEELDEALKELEDACKAMTDALARVADNLRDLKIALLSEGGNE